MEKHYGDLQVEIESVQAEHTRAMTSFTSQMEQAKQQHESMSCRVWLNLLNMYGTTMTFC